MASPARGSAKEVGDAFREMYYDHLQNSPELLHKYYKDYSKISRPGLDGTMRVSTFSDVDEKDLNILSSGGFDSVEVTSFMSQDSDSEGVIVVVAGYFISNERPARTFTQFFILAPQETGYFVLTDIFKFVDKAKANATIPPTTNNVTEEKVPKTEEAADESLNVSKISYASVVSGHSKADNAVDDSRNGKSQEPQAVSEDASIRVAWVPPYATIAWVENAFKQFGKIKRGGTEVRGKKNYKCAFVEFEEPDAAKRAIMAAPIIFEGRRVYVQKRHNCLSKQSGDDTGNGNSQESEGAGICIKRLPPFATIELVANVFKRFGTIKKDGILLRYPGWDYCYGFVEFEKADAAMRAIKASPLSIHGYLTCLEKKRPDYKGYRESPSAAPELRGTEGVVLHEEAKEKEENLREEQGKVQEEEGRENRDRSEELIGAEGVGVDEEEQGKIQEEEGRQYNQNRYRSELMKETGGVSQIPEEEEEEEEN